jgi:hypothetical protein
MKIPRILSNEKPLACPGVFFMEHGDPWQYNLLLGRFEWVTFETYHISNPLLSFKTVVMAKKYVQVEVLLVIGTSFSTGNWVNRDENSNSPQQSEIERLEEACWNGQLKTMLPECWIDPPNDGILYLWGVRQAESFLKLELCEIPLPIDPCESIMPQSFLSFQNNN